MRLLGSLVASAALLSGCGGGDAAGTPCPASALVGLVRVEVPRSAVAGGPVTATLCLEGECAASGVVVTGAQLVTSRPIIDAAPKTLLVRLDLREHGQVVLTASGRIPTRHRSATGADPADRQPSRQLRTTTRRAGH